jgi:hypothetical protein
VHGTDSKKRARWRRIHDDYKAEKTKGTPKAVSVVARRHKVDERTVYRAARKFFQKSTDSQATVSGE